MKGYKVVSGTSTHLRSYSMIGDESLAYAIGVITSRQKGNGPLAVFGTLEDAILFLQSDYSRLKDDDVLELFDVYECEYTPSEDRGLWYVTRSGKKINNLGKIPKCTVFAETVTLVRRITSVGRSRQ